MEVPAVRCTNPSTQSFWVKQFTILPATTGLIKFQASNSEVHAPPNIKTLSTIPFAASPCFASVFSAVKITNTPKEWPISTTGRLPWALSSSVLASNFPTFFALATRTVQELSMALVASRTAPLVRILNGEGQSKHKIVHILAAGIVKAESKPAATAERLIIQNLSICTATD